MLSAVCIVPVAADALNPTTDTDLQTAITNAEDGTVIVLGDSFSISQKITLATDKNVTIDGNGKTISRDPSYLGNLFEITQGTLNLTDSGSGFIIQGQTDEGVKVENTASLIQINSNAHLIMNDGVILRNNTLNSGNSGGAVLVKSSAEFVMNGGLIANNTAKYGGGVENQGTFTMNGGMIINNCARSGGGIDSDSSGVTLIISGNAIVSGNKVEKQGGGVYTGQGSFTMSGNAVISDNEAKENAGGIYVNYGSLEISGNAAISDNEAKGNGGGIFVTAGSFTMSENAVVSGNEAYRGGGLHIQRSVFSMSGGHIINNHAKTGGAAIIFAGDNDDYDGGVDVTLSGGVIKGNTVLETENSNEAINVNNFEKFTISGSFSLEENQILCLENLKSDDTDGFIIAEEFTGQLNLKVQPGLRNDGKTLFTITTNQQAAEGFLEHVNLIDETNCWRLDASGSDKVIITINKPVVKDVTFNWINSSAVTVTVKLDESKGDAKQVKVVFDNEGLKTSSPLIDGNFVSGSIISDIQVTDLTAGTTYSVSVELFNPDLNGNTDDTSTPEDERLVTIRTDKINGNPITTTAPEPSSVIITGEGGTTLPSEVILKNGGGAIFGIIVKDSKGNILEGEKVTWNINPTTNANLEATETTAKITSVTNALTLKATTVALSIESPGVSISVSDAEITSIAFEPVTPNTYELGSEVKVVVTATDANSNTRVGEDVTLTITGYNTPIETTSGTAYIFKPTEAGEYTISANCGGANTPDPQLTLTFISKPTFTTHPASANYIIGQTVVPLTVEATHPTDSTAISYQWYKSTDVNFGDGGQEIIGANTASYTPDITNAGTMYYRAKATYTGGAVPTTENSSTAKITLDDPTVNLITISPSSTSYTLNVGNTVVVTAYAKNTSVNKDDFKVFWYVRSGNDIVSVQQNGNSATITSKDKVGTAVVVATSLDRKIEQSITVSVTTDPTSTIPQGTPHSSSTSQGSSVWLMETQTPTPTATPTPSDAVPTHIPVTQPTETPDSPSPILGILAGLGCAAFVLRRR